jgi:hypothetical protein
VDEPDDAEQEVLLEVALLRRRDLELGVNLETADHSQVSGCKKSSLKQLPLLTATAFYLSRNLLLQFRYH